MVIPYAPTFGSHFKQGKVTTINAEQHTVHLESGEDVGYDVLIICTGSYGPMKEWLGSGDEIVTKYTNFAEQVGKSSEYNHKP